MYFQFKKTNLSDLSTIHRWLDPELDMVDETLFFKKKYLKIN
jgi:hypothetical protein